VRKFFNFETKNYYYNYSYFCSKFLLITENHFWFVPDVAKVLIKLGRKDLKNPVHVEEFRRSYNDNLKHLGNQYIYDVYNNALTERYKTTFNFQLLFMTIWSLVSDPNNFNSLYEIPKGGVLDLTYTPLREF